MVRILLVDDHPAMGEGMKKMIEHDTDMEVTVVLSPLEALDLLEKETFDVMIFDLNMPVINGIELTKRVLKIKPSYIDLFRLRHCSLFQYDRSSRSNGIHEQRGFR